MADKYVPHSATRAQKYDFSNVRAGESLWYETSNERTNAHHAFKAWKERSGSPLSAYTCAVGDEDPRGPGFRLVFERGEVDIKPNLRAIICMYSSGRLDQPDGSIVRWRLERTGIMSDDDILDALADEGETITTIGHAKAFRLKLINGTTRHQVEWCRSMGVTTLKEAAEVMEHRQRQADAERHAKAIGKPENRRAPPPAGMWRGLDAETRAAMRAEGVDTADLFAEAFATFPATWTDAAIVEAIADGQGEWHAYRTRLAAMGEAPVNMEGEI